MQRFGGAAADSLGAATLAHRHDVDGLRAVAVLAIFAFHLDLAGFSGGFVGVDIFFVISGYVILRSILPDLESGRFSLADFFIRRARRILPALAVVLVATLAAGLVILSPDELNELAGSALATIAFGANFFFHDRTGYFASAAHARPLLHMWSLGIEEQFYILVPLMLAVLARLRGISAGKALLVLAVGSFAYSLVAATAARDLHAFYMPMARFWEIAVGGCVAVAERRWGHLSNRLDVIAGLGLAAIAASVLLPHSESAGQRWVMIAVLGTAAVIAAGGSRHSWSATALASRPIVAVGRMSYSIYLVHWPLIVFWRLCTMRPLLPHEQVMIVVLTVVLAAVLSAFVETPLRAGGRRIGNRPALAGTTAVLALVAAAATVVMVDRGAGWRMREPAQEAIALLRDAVGKRPRCRHDEQWLTPALPVCRWNPEGQGTDFVIWGDSHSGALAPELVGVLGDIGLRSGVSARIANCAPIHGVAVVGYKSSERCGKFVDSVVEAIAREKPKIVVMAARWAGHASDVRAPGDGERSGRLLDLENNRAPIQLADALVRTIERVRATGARVILVGPVPEIEYDVPSALVRSLQGFGHLPPVLRADYNVRQRQVLDALAKVSALDGVLVVYPHAVLCNDETCAVADGDRALYTDDDHLSPFGSARVSSLIASALGATKLELAKSDPTRTPSLRE